MIIITLPIALRSPNPAVPMRPVRLADADALHAYCWPNRSLLAIHNLITAARRSQKDERGLGLVVTDQDDKALGYGQFTLWPTCAEISNLAIAEPLRGKGLGTTLIQTLVQKAATLRAISFEIGVAAANQRAANLYRRLGFAYSHSLTLDLGHGLEKVLFLRLDAPHISPN
jgi:ribosomal protein S18 acetylase RimI-like enzyme